MHLYIGNSVDIRICVLKEKGSLITTYHHHHHNLHHRTITTTTATIITTTTTTTAKNKKINKGSGHFIIDSLFNKLIKMLFYSFSSSGPMKRAARTKNLFRKSLRKRVEGILLLQQTTGSPLLASCAICNICFFSRCT